MSTNLSTSNGVARRATITYRILDVLASFVLILGGLAALVTVLNGAFSMALILTVFTALAWANITVFSVIAGYVGARLSLTE